MKQLIKFTLPFLVACAVGPSYSGSKTPALDPAKTSCTPFDSQIASISTDGWVKEAGSCITPFQYRNVEPKPFICTGGAKVGANVSFAVDILSEGTTQYSYRFSSLPVGLGTGEVPNGTPKPIISTAYTTNSVVGIHRVIVSGKAPDGNFQLEFATPKGTVLGPQCWQIPYVNVE